MADILRDTLARLEVLYSENCLGSESLKQIALKPFWTVVAGTQGHCGIALNFSAGKSQDEANENLKIEVNELQSMLGTDLFEVAATLLSRDTPRYRSVATAVLSTLSQPLLIPSALRQRGFSVETEGGTVTSFVRESDSVAMIGYAGILGQLIGKCRQLRVTEMRSRDALQTIVVGQEIRFGPSEISVHTAAENKAVLGSADVVFITASTLVNGTFDEVVGYAQNARQILIYGPTASLIPDVLFARGVDTVLTMAITDPKDFETRMFDVTEGPWASQSVFHGQQMLRIWPSEAHS